MILQHVFFLGPDTFYIIGQIIISITNHKCNVVAMKTVLMRFDGIDNLIF